MKLFIHLLASGKRLRIDADPDMLAEELLEQLIELQIILPPGNCPYFFRFENKLYGTCLDLEKSLQANNVEENDIIVLAAIVPDG